MYGYRKPPVINDTQQEEPLNKFQVIDCSVVRQDKIKQNAFVIYFNQVRIERLFAASSQQDRYETNTFFDIVVNDFCINLGRNGSKRLNLSINEQHLI